MAVGSTVVRQRYLKHDQKMFKKNGKEKSTTEGSRYGKLLRQSDLMNEKDETKLNSENRKYECGVCSFVSYNRNDFQVFFYYYQSAWKYS